MYYCIILYHCILLYYFQTLSGSSRGLCYRCLPSFCLLPRLLPSPFPVFHFSFFRLYNETTHSPPPNSDQRSHSYIFRDIPQNSTFPLFFNVFSRFCIFSGLYHFCGVHKRITMLYNDHAINERGSPLMVARCRVEP